MGHRMGWPMGHIKVSASLRVCGEIEMAVTHVHGNGLTVITPTGTAIPHFLLLCVGVRQQTEQKKRTSLKSPYFLKIVLKQNAQQTKKWFLRQKTRKKHCWNVPGTWYLAYTRARPRNMTVQDVHAVVPDIRTTWRVDS